MGHIISTHLMVIHKDIHRQYVKRSVGLCSKEYLFTKPTNYLYLTWWPLHIRFPGCAKKCLNSEVMPVCSSRCMHSSVACANYIVQMQSYNFSELISPNRKQDKSLLKLITTFKWLLRTSIGSSQCENLGTLYHCRWCYFQDAEQHLILGFDII